jgi:hypothetical protein
MCFMVVIYLQFGLKKATAVIKLTNWFKKNI